MKNNDSVFASITGIIGEVVGIVVFESVFISVSLAFLGGLAGYLGKEVGRAAIKKYKDWKNSDGIC